MGTGPVTRRPVLCLFLLLGLLGCREGDTSGGAERAAAPGMDLSDQPGRPTERKAAFSLRVPAAALEATARTQAASCRPPECDLTLLTIQVDRPRIAMATLEMRLLPAAFPGFLNRLAEAGRIISANESSTDLTAPTRDADARLAAQRSLRDRLTGTLAERSAMPLTDLLAWERELARVQGEIESAESILRALSVRAGMIAVAVAYEGARDGWLPDGIAPIEDAVRGGLALAIGSLAEAISFVMVALPWLPIVAGGWLLITWATRRGRGRAVTAAAPPPSKAP